MFIYKEDKSITYKNELVWGEKYVDGSKRGIVVAIGLLIQILLTLFIYLKFGEFISIIQVVYGLLSIIIVLMIIKYSKRLSSDLIWILLIMLFPLIGTLLYIILSNNMKRSKVLKNINENIENGQKYLIQDEFIKKKSILKI